MSGQDILPMDSIVPDLQNMFSQNSELACLALRMPILR